MTALMIARLEWDLLVWFIVPELRGFKGCLRRSKSAAVVLMLFLYGAL
jgi:hypothetical protein